MNLTMIKTMHIKRIGKFVTGAVVLSSLIAVMAGCRELEEADEDGVEAEDSEQAEAEDSGSGKEAEPGSKAVADPGSKAVADPESKETVKKAAGSGGPKLPNFTLKSPHGDTFTRKDLLKTGAVIVVTSPTLKNKKEQGLWAKFLLAERHNSKGRLVFLQDMSPSAFKALAVREMKRQSKRNKDPLLLIDPKGKLRKGLRVAKEATTVLVFNQEGQLVHKEDGKPSKGAAAKIWKQLE